LLVIILDFIHLPNLFQFKKYLQNHKIIIAIDPKHPHGTRQSIRLNHRSQAKDRVVKKLNQKLPQIQSHHF
jgi:hypothetical protein